MAKTKLAIGQVLDGEVKIVGVQTPPGKAFHHFPIGRSQLNGRQELGRGFAGERIGTAPHRIDMFGRSKIGLESVVAYRPAASWMPMVVGLIDVVPLRAFKGRGIKD